MLIAGVQFFLIDALWEIIMVKLNLYHVSAFLSFIGNVLIASLFWWDVAFNFIPESVNLISYISQHGLPYPELVSKLTIIFLIIFPALLFLKSTEVIGFFGLALFCIATALIFHQYWRFEGDDRTSEQIHFMKDLALAGAMIVIVSMRIERDAS